MLYIQFDIANENPSATFALITEKFCGDNSWVDRIDRDGYVILDLELTAKMQYTLGEDLAVLRWDDSLWEASFKNQETGETELVLLPFWHFSSYKDLNGKRDVSPDSPIWGEGGPYGWGGASAESIEQAGGRVIGVCENVR